MRINRKLLSYILTAAMLCGIFASCATTQKPPLPEITESDKATPDTVFPTESNTTAPMEDTTDTPPEDTSLPIDDTAKPEDSTVTADTTADTSSAVSDTTAASTAAVTETTAASETTAPVTEPPTLPEPTPEELQSEKLKELMYLTDDGYVKIKGADTIKLPASGTLASFVADYTKFSNLRKAIERIGVFYASEHTCITEQIQPEPQKAAPTYYFEEGKLYISYNNGENTIQVVGELQNQETGEITLIDTFEEAEIKAWKLSDEYCFFTINKIWISVHNMGKKIYIASNVDYATQGFLGEIGVLFHLSNTTAYLAGPSVLASGLHYTSMVFTRDGGKTFYPTRYVSNSMTFSGTIHNGRIYTDDSGIIHRSFQSINPDNDFINLANVYSYYCIQQAVGPWPSTMQTWSYLPYFEGNIGVWQAALRKEDHNTYYIFYITLDGGMTWTIYNPGNLADVDGMVRFDYYDWR